MFDLKKLLDDFTAPMRQSFGNVGKAVGQATKGQPAQTPKPGTTMQKRPQFSPGAAVSTAPQPQKPKFDFTSVVNKPMQPKVEPVAPQSVVPKGLAAPHLETQKRIALANPQPKVNPVKDFSDFVAGSNEKFMGGAARGAANIVNQVATGFNQEEAERRTNDFMRSSKQVNKQGTPQLAVGANKQSTAYKVGEVSGTGQGIVADIATTALPGIGAEKILRAAPIIKRGLDGASKAKRIASGVTAAVGGGAVSTAINQAKDPGQDAGQNFAQGAAFDAGMAVLPPAISAAIRYVKGSKSLPGYINPSSPGRRTTNSPSPQSLVRPEVATQQYPVRGNALRVDTLIKGQETDRLSSSFSPSVSPGGSYPASGGRTDRVAEVQRQVPKSTKAKIEEVRVKSPSITNIIDPLVTGGQVRNRGFTNSVMDNAGTPVNVQAGLMNNDTGYKVRNTQNLVDKAGALVKSNLDEAERIANTGSDDVSQAVGLELLRKHQLDGNYEAAIRRVEDIAEKATKNGQATQILAAYGRLTPEGALRFTQRQIDRYNDSRNLVGKAKAAKLTPDKAQEVVEAAKRVQELPEGAAKSRAIAELTQTMETAAPTPLMQKITSIWKAGLLTSARTLEGGIIGNTTKAALDLPSQAIAAGVDKFVTAPLFNKGVRSNVFTLRGAASGTEEGLKQAKDYLKTGIDPRDAAAGFDHKGINWEQGNKVINAVGKKSDLVYRTLGAIDNPFYYAAKGRANFEEAAIEASKRGLKGSEKKNFIADYAKNLSDSSEDAAVATAKEAVFQNDTMLGGLASKFKRLPQIIGIKDPVKRDAVQAIVDFTIPFAKIPGAVATALVDYSPVGAPLKVIESVINKGRGVDVDMRALNASIGKSATGTIGGVWLGKQLYDNGLLTLDEPADEKERQLWQAEGKQKFSIKILGEWRSMNYIQPLGGLMALGGGFSRAQDNGEDFGTALATAALTGVKSVTQQSFLQGVSDTISAVEDPARNAPKLLNNKAGSVIPNVVRDAARATDTKEREANNALEAITNGIPGLRQGNLAQRDLYGNEIETKQSPLGVMADPFKSTKAKSDDVTTELRRLYETDPKELGVVPTKLAKDQTLGGTNVRLTPKQLDALEATAGPETYNLLNEAIKNPRYLKLSDEDKSKKIDNIIEANRANARKGLAATETFQNKKGEDVAVDASKIDVPKISLNATGENKTYKEKYESAKEEFDTDSKDWTPVTKLKKQKELNRLTVQKDYDNDTVDLYSMNKDVVYKFVSEDPEGNGNKKVQDILTYGDALVAAGVEQKNKFRDKYGNLALTAPDTKSGGKGKGKGKGKTKFAFPGSTTNFAYNNGTLRRLLGNTTVSKGASKVAKGPTLKNKAKVA